MLGFDFLKENNLVMDCAKLAINTKSSFFVKLSKSLELEPSSETVVWGNIDQHMQFGTGLVSCNATMPQQDLVVASAAILPYRNKVPVRILNPSMQWKTLQKDSKIANLTTLPSEIQLHETDDNEESNKTCDCSKTTDETELKANAATANTSSDSSQIPKEFKDIFDLQHSTFTLDQREKLFALLWEFQDIFSKPDGPLGCTKLITFHIVLEEDATLFKARPYKSNSRIRDEISKQVQEMLNNNIIEPSTSPFGSPVLLVTKQDGTFRFCIDYRKLNTMTKIHCHPLNRTDDCRESLGSAHANSFSSLYLESGY